MKVTLTKREAKKLMDIAFNLHCDHIKWASAIYWKLEKALSKLENRKDL